MPIVAFGVDRFSGGDMCSLLNSRYADADRRIEFGFLVDRFCGNFDNEGVEYKMAKE